MTGSPPFFMDPTKPPRPLGDGPEYALAAGACLAERQCFPLARAIRRERSFLAERQGGG